MKIFVSTLTALALITFAFIIIKGGNNSTVASNGNNVTVVDGKQIIDLTAKGGYSPEKSTAKAGMPTILRFTTSGTFDCSSFVRIPSMNVGKSLALTGTTDIDLGNPKEGILRGSCGMGMYPFEINFKS
jgi:plastocyanin domain-containing protein